MWKYIIEDNKDLIKKLDEICKILTEEYKNLTDNYSLMGGNTGITLFFYYYYKLKNDDKYLTIANDIIESCFETFQKANQHFTFSGGLAGLAGFEWLIDHCNNEDFINCDTKIIFEDVNDILSQNMMFELNRGNYDYLHGALGYGLRLLNKKNCKDSMKQLTQVVIALEKSCIKENNIVKWGTFNNEVLNKDDYNFGLSHGIPSIIAFLTKVYKLNILPETSLELITKSANFILENKLDIKTYNSFFPNSVKINNPSTTKKSSRLGWCYGDLGVCASLLQASELSHNNNMKTEILNILAYNTKRKNLDDNFVVDASLCHGTAGIAHIFNRIYQHTKREEFKDTAIYWYNETLKMAKFDDGLAGYKTWRANKYGGFQNNYSLLEGIAGIGLSLISAVSDIEPKWDECFLLS